MRPGKLVVPSCLFLFVLSVYLLSGAADLLHNGDTDLRYQTAQAIVDFHRLWIAHPMWLDTRVQLGRGHHLYAFYAPGQTLLMVPLYVAGKVVAHHLVLPYDVTTLYACRSIDLWLGAVLAVLFYLLARAAGYSERVAAVLTLVLALASVMWPDAQSALEQMQVNVFLLFAVLCMWRALDSPRGRWYWVALSGTVAGLSVFTRYDAAVYLPVLAVVLFFALRRRVAVGRRLLATAVFLGATLPWLGGIAIWDWLRFGDPFLTGLHEKTWGEPVWKGLAGLLVSPGKGFLWYLPLVFLLPWAVPAFRRRRPDLALLCAALVAVPVLLYANVLYWHGDPAWGPRYLYTAVPYLVLPLGEIFSRWTALRPSLRLWTVGLLALSAALQVEAIAVTQWRFWYRLEAKEEHTAQPFRWGASYYHYYWDLGSSPLWIQADNVYQVVKLDALGQTQYRLTARPTACTPSRCPSNPAQLYPVNTLNFWWADTLHPLLGARTRYALAMLLALGALAALLGLGWSLWPENAPWSRLIGTPGAVAPEAP